jgi:hypothetical protein
MAKLTPFALAAIALLGACSTAPSQPTAANINTIVHPLRAGTGVVQAVMPAPMMAAAGGTAASSTEPMQRLEVKMSDGRVQYIDTPSREIAKGDRIQLGADGIIRKV